MQLLKGKLAERTGIIPLTSQLGAALCYFAGGSAYDLSIMFGMSVKEIYRSVWIVVDAINKCNRLKIKFPANHEVQVAGFHERSGADVYCCLGAIDDR